VVPLIDYEMSSCRMCGRCVPSQRCARDEAFNRVFEKMIESDGLFLVVPHYAPLPSKLMILMEKMEEIAYLNWCANPGYRFPLHDRPAGVIGHGGQETSGEVLAYYQRMVVEPVAMALRSVSMRVIGAGGESPHGTAFGIQSLRKPEDSFFVDIQHDWEDIRHRITPLVQNVALSLRGPAA
jgi:multimeric flavodoxin WrbA